MTQHLDLDALQAAAEAATSGPWTAQEPDGAYHEWNWSVRCPSRPPAISHELCRLSSINSNEDADAAFIAAFNPQTAKALIDRLRKAEAAREGWKWVPQIPTADMVNVFMRHMTNEPEGDGVEQVVEGLALMIDAAPDSTPTDSVEADHG